MRKFKSDLMEFLQHKEFESRLEKIHRLPPKKTVNALFSFLCSPDPNLKNRAAKAMGAVVSHIAKSDIEYARIIVRRLIVSLTEESGGIGWGAPIAMGEIMAAENRLAHEFHKILISYAQDDDNYLDFEGLQKDVISGIKILARVHPEMVQEVKHLL